MVKKTKRSCETQLVGFINDLTKGSRKWQVDVAITDFSKAFDVVHQGRLLLKLNYYGIRNETLQRIKAFLLHDGVWRQQRVIVDGAVSDTAEVISGVPQGPVLGSLLFLLYISDLPGQVSSSVWLFADDCVLYGNIKSLQNTLALQQDLNSLTVWKQTWKI